MRESACSDYASLVPWFVPWSMSLVAMLARRQAARGRTHRPPTTRTTQHRRRLPPLPERPPKPVASRIPECVDVCGRVHRLTRHPVLVRIHPSRHAVVPPVPDSLRTGSTSRDEVPAEHPGRQRPHVPDRRRRGHRNRRRERCGRRARGRIVLRHQHHQPGPVTLRCLWLGVGGLFTDGTSGGHRERR